MGGGGPSAQPRTASSAAVLGFITTWEVIMGSGKRSKTRCRRLKSSIAAAAIRPYAGITGRGRGGRTKNLTTSCALSLGATSG